MRNSKSGQISLPVILLIGGIVVEIGIIGASFSYLLISGGYGERLSAQAWVYSQSGLQDVFLKIARNKDYFASGPCNLDFGSSRNKCGLTVTRDGSKVTIVSTGETALRKRKLEAVLSVDQFTGKTYLVSLLEKTL